MSESNSTRTGARGYRLYPMLAPFPLAFFLGAFATDLVYWSAPDAMWETFSVWLITAGLLLAGVSVVAGLIDFGSRRVTADLPYALAIVLAFVLALINAFVHSRDGYTAVVPTGVILSALVTLILLAAAWMRRDAVYRHREGVLQ